MAHALVVSALIALAASAMTFIARDSRATRQHTAAPT